VNESRHATGITFNESVRTEALGGWKTHAELVDAKAIRGRCIASDGTCSVDGPDVEHVKDVEDAWSDGVRRGRRRINR